jgi:hypothetical protein
MLADVEVKKAEMEATMLQERQKLDFEREKMGRDNMQKELDREQQWKIELLKINAQAQVAQTKASNDYVMHGEKLKHDERTKKSEGRNKQNDALIAQGKDPLPDENKGMMEVMQALTKALSAPKRVVRGPDGRASHVETVQ